MFTINLNNESAAVLLRALSYGQNAISKKETESGKGKIIEENIESIRSQVCRELSERIIEGILTLKE